MRVGGGATEPNGERRDNVHLNQHIRHRQTALFFTGIGAEDADYRTK
jgi:hypothetical protein